MTAAVTAADRPRGKDDFFANEVRRYVLTVYNHQNLYETFDEYDD